MLARELLRAVRQIVTSGRAGRDGRRRGLAAVRPRGDHRDPRAPCGDGGDQRPGCETAMSRLTTASSPTIASSGTPGPRSTRRATSTTSSASGTIRPMCGSSPGSGGGRRRDRRRLLHLQCHFGLDTLSWARLGASTLRGRLQRAGDRVRERARGRDGAGGQGALRRLDIYDLPGPLAGETFDVVYTGRGVLGWLPELRPWARAVAGFVRPGGIFYIHEGHPVMWAIADEQDTPNRPGALGFDYWGGETLSFPVEGSYADPPPRSTPTWSTDGITPWARS